MKNFFNKAVQCGEDAYYGIMFDSMAGQRKLRLNLIAGLCTLVGGHGLLRGDPSSVAVAALMLGSVAAAFGVAGSNIRKNTTVRQPTL